MDINQASDMYKHRMLLNLTSTGHYLFAELMIDIIHREQTVQPTHHSFASQGQEVLARFLKDKRHAKYDPSENPQAGNGESDGWDQLFFPT